MKKRLLRRSFLTALAAAACCASALPAAAQLNPYVSAQVGYSTATFAWANSGGPYNAIISTDSSFAVVSDSMTVGPPSATMNNLIPDTRQFFRVKQTSQLDTAYAFNGTASTYTMAAPPLSPSLVSESFSTYGEISANVQVNWNVNGNPIYTEYEMEYALNIGMAGSSKIYEPYPPVMAGGLDANTTYYFRVRALNTLDDIPTTWTAIVSSSTLALPLSGINTQVWETSATVSWTPVVSGTQRLSSEGYRVTVSSSPIFAWTTAMSSTAVNTASFFTFNGLARNTTYYFRAATLNWGGAPNNSGTLSFTTLPSRPASFQLLSVGAETASAGWAALPGSPQSSSAAGYVLEASSTSFDGSSVPLSSATASLSASTLTVSGLDANTAWQFRAGSLGPGGGANYSVRLSTVTRALPVSPGLAPISVSSQSLRVEFTPPFPASPQRFSCQGYLLQISSRNFASDGLIYSTFSANPETYSLALTGLDPNTLYAVRLATLDIAGGRNFARLADTRTDLPQAYDSVPLAAVWETSATVNFPSTDSQGYVLEASKNRYFLTIHRSSFTPNPLDTSVTVENLDRNTLYYFRFGPVFNGTTAYTITTPDSRSTLAAKPGSPSYSGVFFSSATLSWTPLATAPQSATAEGYLLEASTSPDFVPVHSASSTINIENDRLTVDGLSPNTSYYFRVGTSNWDSVLNYAAVAVSASTSTMANIVGELPHSNLTTWQMTVNWNVNSNPPDTRYLVEISSVAGFANTVLSSVTLNASATFGTPASNLLPNKAYNRRVTSINRLGVRAGPLAMAPIATMAFSPVAGVPSNVSVSSLAVSWGHGLNPAGITTYRAEASSSPVFAEPVISSDTLMTSATFFGLVPNTTYHMRISAVNQTNITTTPQYMGAALTFPTTAQPLAPDQAFTGMLLDGFTVAWDPNGNSWFTAYAVEVSTLPDFSVMAASGSTTASSLSFSGLASDTTYYAQVRARGQTGALTPFIVAGATTTLYLSQLNAAYGRNNTITLPSSYGDVTVFASAGALGGSTRIRLTPYSTAGLGEASSVATLRATGVGVQITYSPLVQIFKPLMITLPYRLTDLPPGTDRSRLVIAYYDAPRGRWVPLPSVSDTAANRVTGQTWHLSVFQLMEAVPGAGLSGAKIYPNPYRPSSQSEYVHFTNLTPGAKIRIYTFLGELVRELSAGLDGTAFWDGANSSRQQAASGIYIVHMKSADGSQQRTAKLAVER